MAVRSFSNNRVLPSNSRSVDVAKSTVDRIIPIEARAYDNAFRVQGYTGILYSRMEGGPRCACRNMSEELASRLGSDGKADPGTINRLMTGGMDFGVFPYGTKAPTVLEVQLPSILDADLPEDILREQSPHGTHLDRYGSDSANPTHGTILESGLGVNGPIQTDELDDFIEGTIQGHSDHNCPICFGTGFVGGFEPLYGWRKVLTGFNGELTGYLDTVQGIPVAYAESCSWEVTFPMNAEFVDSCTLYRGTTPISWKSLSIDSEEILTPIQLRNFCDGRPHAVVLTFEEAETQFTHLELQIGVSRQETAFELPRQTNSGNQSLLEQRSDFSVVLSPLIPKVKPLDIIAESTSQGILQVKSVQNFHDRNRSILGWDVEVRAVQPQELFSILPTRSPQRRPNRPAYVRDNLSGRRT